MKKFLLTLLFLLFANPIFAQTKPTSKTNIDIKISETTNKSLTNIKTSFTGYITTNLCNETKKKDIVSIKDKEFNNTTCDSHTIGETYNCICDKNDSKYKTFYKSVEAITNFTDLKTNENIVNQFQKIKNFYDALNELPKLIGDVNNLSEEIKRLKGQEAADEADRKAKINVLKEKLITTLKEKIEKEKKLREEHPDIVKDLEKDKKLKPHPDNGIKNYMTNQTNDAEKAAKDYIEKVLNNLLKNNPNATAEDLEKSYNDDEGNETKTTQHNIDAIDKAAKDKEKADKDKKLKELLDLKKQEANLINELGKTKTPAVTVAPINDTDINGKNYNNPNKNKELNSALDKLIEEKSAHDEEKKAETIDKIQTEIDKTNHNIDELNKLKDKLEQEKNKLNKELNDNYDKIKILLHKQNKEECLVFGKIGITNTQITNYQQAEVKGEYITCNNETKTFNEIINSNSIEEKTKWDKCLQKELDKFTPNENLITTYINKIKSNYSGIDNCTLDCTNKAPNYNSWYIGKKIATKYSNKNGKTIEEQLTKCQLDNFKCIADDGQELLLSDYDTYNTLNEKKERCEEAKKEYEINNFDCSKVGITINASLLPSIKEKIRTKLNPNLTVKEVGEQECKDAYRKAQEEAEKAKISLELTNAIKQLQNYCCNGTEINRRNCPPEINLNGTEGNYRVKINFLDPDESPAQKIINILTYVSELECPDDKDIINNIHNNIFIKTIYIGNLQSPNSNCSGNKYNLTHSLSQRSQPASKNYLGLTKKFCEWNGQ